MVTPSNKYSDIGDFTSGESGWWFGKSDTDHEGLQQKLTDLGVDVIHRGTSAEISDYTPEPGAAFYAEDTEVLHLGDGTQWNAQATWGTNPTFEQVTASNAPSAATDVVRQQELSGDISPSSVDTERQSIKGDVGALLSNGSVVAQGLSDPVYPVSEYTDLADCLNAVLSDMSTELGHGTLVHLPPLGDHMISSGKITIPAFTKFENPTFIGPNKGYGQLALNLKIDTAFPDEHLFEAIGSDRGGLTFQDFRVGDGQGYLTDSIFHIESAGHLTFKNIKTYVTGCDAQFYIVDGVDTLDFLRMDNINIGGLGAGQAGIRTTAGQVVTTHVAVTGTGADNTYPSNSIGIDLQGASGDWIHTHLSKLDIGIRVKVDPSIENTNTYSRGHALYPFVELPGVEVNHPVWLENGYGHTVTPLKGATRFYRHSVDAAVDTCWNTDRVRTAHSTTVSGGGAQAPAKFGTSSGTADANANTVPDSQRIAITAPSGSSEWMDNGGNPPVSDSSSPLEDMAPTFTWRAKEATVDGSITRIGLVESQWTDWAGLYYDRTEGNYRLKVVKDGTEVTNKLLSFGTNFNSTLGTVKISPGPFVSIGVMQTGQGSANGVGHATADTSAQSAFGQVQTTYHVDNTAGASSADMELWEGRLQLTRD